MDNSVESPVFNCGQTRVVHPVQNPTSVICERVWISSELANGSPAAKTSAYPQSPGLINTFNYLDIQLNKGALK